MSLYRNLGPDAATEPCGLCGKPATGFASVWDGENDVRYCHGDFDAVPTCYERWGWGTDTTLLADFARELGVDLGDDLSTIPTDDPQPNPAIPGHAERAGEL